MSSMKHRETRHWGVQPVVMKHNEYALLQAGDVIAVGFFADVNEAKFVAHRLNAGKLVYEALRHLVNVDSWTADTPKTLMDDALIALAEYARHDY